MIIIPQLKVKKEATSDIHAYSGESHIDFPTQKSRKKFTQENFIHVRQFIFSHYLQYSPIIVKKILPNFLLYMSFYFLLHLKILCVLQGFTYIYTHIYIYIGQGPRNRLPLQFCSRIHPPYNDIEQNCRGTLSGTLS